MYSIFSVLSTSKISIWSKIWQDNILCIWNKNGHFLVNETWWVALSVGVVGRVTQLPFFGGVFIIIQVWCLRHAVELRREDLCAGFYLVRSLYRFFRFLLCLHNFQLIWCKCNMALLEHIHVIFYWVTMKMIIFIAS